jgi:ketosteroid isomerase-like protein
MKSATFPRDTERAMPLENVETVRRYLGAYQRRDVEEGISFLHSGVTWRAIEGAPDDIGVFQGHQAMRDYYQDWLDIFADARSELVEDLIEIGDRVVAVVRYIGRMTGSDTQVEMTLAIVFTVRDGKIASGREYATRTEALEAAGLRE